MVFPYRTPAPIDPDLPASRTPELDRWLRAVSFATVIFLLTATAMMLSLMSSLAGSRLAPRSPAPLHAATCAPHETAAKALPPPSSPPPSAHRASLSSSGPMTPRAFTPPLDLATLGAPTHDPATLLARATRLLGDGADLTLTRSTLPMPIHEAIEEGFAPHARIAARVAWGGVEIKSLPLGSTASLAGLQRGDVLTAINGYALTRPEDVIEAHRSLLATGVAVLEVIRGERRVVIEARFRRAGRGGVR
jgi:hypothetical protein